MKIAVTGLWHLGSVTAACLADAGHDVLGWDGDAGTVESLRRGDAPIYEPGLGDLLAKGLESGRLSFSSNLDSLRDRELIWVAYDTPVDDEDRADVGWVTGKVAGILPCLATDTLVVISSQLPAGTTAALERIHREECPGGNLRFAYVPENLRLGQAIEAFVKAPRIVAGIRSDRERETLAPILQSFTDTVLWMSIESAEMTKHALNAFLATSVSFANEVAVLCERVGADARDVERALRSDARVGARAYLRAGSAFAGGTLARDLSFLSDIGQKVNVPTYLMDSVRLSNQRHLHWAGDTLKRILGPLAGRTVAVLGLTYKPGTDTLRRSAAVESCNWLVSEGASVRAYDPVIRSLPPELAGVIELKATARDAVMGSDAMFVATEWPEFTRIPADDLLGLMRQPIVVDPGRFLEASLGTDDRLQYVAVGRYR